MTEQEQNQPEVELEQAEVEQTEQVESTETEQDNGQEVVSDIERVAELERELAAAKSTIEQQKDSVIRAAAEVDNVRRRAALDVEKAHKYALEKFVTELLPVIDNMERALLAADREQDVILPMIEGVEMTMKSFIEGVGKFGVELIDPQGEPFNPELHQAMTMQPSADVEPNTVIAVMQKGYQLNGRLLRPAMVMVSKAP